MAATSRSSAARPLLVGIQERGVAAADDEAAHRGLLVDQVAGQVLGGEHGRADLVEQQDARVGQPQQRRGAERDGPDRDERGAGRTEREDPAQCPALGGVGEHQGPTSSRMATSSSSGPPL
jgi:hypothetical protein